MEGVVNEIPTWPELAYRLTHCDECDCHCDFRWPGCSCVCHDPEGDPME